MANTGSIEGNTGGGPWTGAGVGTRRPDGPTAAVHTVLGRPVTGPDGVTPPRYTVSMDINPTKTHEPAGVTARPTRGENEGRSAR